MNISICVFACLSFSVFWIKCKNKSEAAQPVGTEIDLDSTSVKEASVAISALDTSDYNRRVLSLAHDSISKRWPVSDLPFPEAEAILPFYLSDLNHQLFI